MQFYDDFVFKSSWILVVFCVVSVSDKMLSNTSIIDKLFFVFISMIYFPGRNVSFLKFLLFTFCNKQGLSQLNWWLPIKENWCWLMGLLKVNINISTYCNAERNISTWQNLIMQKYLKCSQGLCQHTVAGVQGWSNKCASLAWIMFQHTTMNFRHSPRRGRQTGSVGLTRHWSFFHLWLNMDITLNDFRSI